jgi:hypothetical protein
MPTVNHLTCCLPAQDPDIANMIKISHWGLHTRNNSVGTKTMHKVMSPWPLRAAALAAPRAPGRVQCNVLSCAQVPAHASA